MEPDPADHHGSHRHLLRPVRVPAAAHNQVDLIAVPTSRPVSYLAQAVRLAERLGAALLVLASGRCSASEVERVYRGRLAGRLIVVDVPIGYARYQPEFRFEADAIAAGAANRSSDISVKRNIALVVARAIGVRRLFFLDDDIIVPDWVDARRAATAVGRTHRAAALFVDGYPDNSVVCHANREAGGVQDVFVGGGALMVDPQRVSAFFPNVYNEDWFFLLDRVAERAVATIGTAVQRPYDPFGSPVRAAREEFGDVLAESLFWLLDLGGSTADAGPEFWAQAVRRRRRFLDDVRRRVDTMDAPSRQWRITASLDAAEAAHRDFTPGVCAWYVEALGRDRRAWADRLATFVRRCGRGAGARRLGDVVGALGLPMADCADPGLVFSTHRRAGAHPLPEPLADGHGEPLWGLRSPATIAAAGRRAVVPSVDSSLTA